MIMAAGQDRSPEFEPGHLFKLHCISRSASRARVVGVLMMDSRPVVARVAVMSHNGHRALLLGSHGGVGRALLAVLEHTGPGRRLLDSLDALLLVDRVPPAAATG